MHPRMVATKHSKLPKIFKTQSPYINPVISPVKMLQLSTPSNSNLSTLTLHMVMEEQQLHLSPEICFSHITSDLSNPPVSPVKMVAIICTTTHAAEKKVNMLICKQIMREENERETFKYSGACSTYIHVHYTLCRRHSQCF